MRDEGISEHRLLTTVCLILDTDNDSCYVNNARSEVYETRLETMPARGEWEITINTKGWIAMNGLTHQKLGEPEYVQLLFDEKTNTIGLNPVGRLATDAYLLGKRWNNGRLIYGKRLITEFGLKLPVTLRFMNPEIDEDGILILDLNDTRPAVIGKNSRVPAKNADAS